MMERMTIRRDFGITMAPGLDFYFDPDDYDTVQKVLAKLTAYEDTGLDPEQLLRPGDPCPCCGEPILTTNPLKLLLLSLLQYPGAKQN